MLQLVQALSHFTSLSETFSPTLFSILLWFTFTLISLRNLTFQLLAPCLTLSACTSGSGKRSGLIGRRQQQQDTATCSTISSPQCLFFCASSCLCPFHFEMISHYLSWNFPRGGQTPMKFVLRCWPKESYVYLGHGLTALLDPSKTSKSFLKVLWLDETVSTLAVLGYLFEGLSSSFRGWRTLPYSRCQGERESLSSWNFPNQVVRRI